MIMFQKFQKIVRTLDTFMMSAAVLLISLKAKSFLRRHLYRTTPIKYSVFGQLEAKNHSNKILLVLSSSRIQNMQLLLRIFIFPLSN